MAPARAEILEILASHAGQPVDYLALYMFLNTVAGGHYQERYGAEEIERELRELLHAGAIEAWQGERRLPLQDVSIMPGGSPCHFRLARG